jgi:hypothetical protein
MTLSALYRSSFKIIFLLLIVPTGLLAQGTIPNYTALVDIIPPSPNSASLGKYAGINVGLVSGMANISVPLNEFTSNNLHVPLSVNYSSNGLKVDEIASRVGLGWTFNAGGAITRTVSGLPDEQVPRLLPPSDFPTPDQNFINFADELNNTAANDGQPDLFSFNFNGYSGQFMLDNNLNPVLLTYSSLKIEKNFIGTDWNFKVTTPDGVQYFFGGSDATETSNKSQMNCGRIFPNFAATAWYVNKIVHPNQDTVVFNYTINGAYDYFTGVSQTAYSGLIAFGVNLGSTYAPPNPPNTTCISSLTTISPLLTSITSSAGGTIKFFYINRPDIGDKLLNRIEYYQPNQSAFYKFYNLSYQTVRSPNYNSNVLPSDTTLYYRPFLTEIDEGNPVNSQQKTHVFTYNNLNQLPARLSFAQDDYGYFNGANNGSLIPVPPSYIPASDFTSANANRTPNPIYSVNGTLAKIQYPTGGSDSLVYEANTYYAEIQALNNQIVNLEGAGIGQLTPNTIVSANFHLTNSSVNVLAALSGSCTYNSNSGYTYDPVHNTAEFSIIDSASNTAVFDQSYATGQTISLPNAATLLLGHTYYLKATPRGAGVVVGFNLSYVDGTLPPVFADCALIKS